MKLREGESLEEYTQRAREAEARRERRSRFWKHTYPTLIQNVLLLLCVVLGMTLIGALHLLLFLLLTSGLTSS